MFVNNDILSTIRSQMCEALCATVGLAYQCFGHPDADRCGSCLVADKFPMTAGPAVEFIGFLINTRKLQVKWPADKVEALHAALHDWIHHPMACTPKEIVQLLGYIRNGTYLCPFGNFTSTRLQ